MFEGQETIEQEGGFIALLDGLPLVHTSHGEHQKQAPFCVDLLEKSKWCFRQRKILGL
jgi:hypothetical protein